jgi:hypothetical protein
MNHLLLDNGAHYTGASLSTQHPSRNAPRELLSNLADWNRRVTNDSITRKAPQGLKTQDE